MFADALDVLISFCKTPMFVAVERDAAMVVLVAWLTKYRMAVPRTLTQTNTPIINIE
jgi:hypothetical protein